MTQQPPAALKALDAARAAYYAAREAAESAYYAYSAARRSRPRKKGMIANKMTAAGAAYDAAASVYFSALDGAAAALDGAASAEASNARYEWYRSAPGISSRAHDIVQWTNDLDEEL